MDVRFLAVVALVMAIMEIMGRIAKRGRARQDEEAVEARDLGGPFRSLEGDESPAREARRTAAAPTPPRRPFVVEGEGPLTPERLFEALKRRAAEASAGAAPPPVAVARPAEPIVVDAAAPEARRRLSVPSPAAASADLPDRREGTPDAPERRRSRSAAGRAAPAPRSSDRGRRRRSARPEGLSSRDGLRRLVVAREVLGPPLALRPRGQGDLPELERAP